MIKQKLTDVPDHIIVRPSSVKSGAKWQSDYNVAGWFRFKELTHELIKLHIYWVDEAGEQSTCIDQTTITSNSVLLSGIGRLKITGPLKSISVAIESNRQNYIVDELFVQPSRPNALPSSRNA